MEREGDYETSTSQSEFSDLDTPYVKPGIRRLCGSGFCGGLCLRVRAAVTWRWSMVEKLRRDSQRERERERGEGGGGVREN